MAARFHARAKNWRRCLGWAVRPPTLSSTLHSASQQLPSIPTYWVGNRTGLATGKTPLEVEMKLEQVVPVEYKQHAHHWLILHGRYTCVARKPLCEKCIIADLCQWPGKTVV